MFLFVLVFNVVGYCNAHKLATIRKCFVWPSFGEKVPRLLMGYTQMEGSLVASYNPSYPLNNKIEVH